MSKGTLNVDGTTEQQKLFAYAYFNNGGHGTNAAIEAGYSEKTATQTASRLLTYVNVKSLLSNLHDTLKERVVVTKERIAEELAKIGLFDIRTCYTDSGALLPIKDLPCEAASVIAGIKVYEEKLDGQKIGETVEVKLNSKISALAELSKIYGYYAPAKVANTDTKGNDVTPTIQITTVTSLPIAETE